LADTGDRYPIQQEVEIMSNKQLFIGGAVIVAAIVAVAVWAARDFQLFPTQDVVLHSCPSEGLVLDIGGGGEGIIGRLMGDRVVAVDLSRDELEGAPPGNIKMVMDARELAFLDGSFHTATSFCTLMYIEDQEDQRQVLAEVLRVLRPGGRFLIWDVVVPAEHKEGKTTAVFPMKISLPGDTVRTAYGVAWPQETHDLAYYARLAALAGPFLSSRKRRPQGTTTTGAPTNRCSRFCRDTRWRCRSCRSRARSSTSAVVAKA
jgi:SAM-dependent methyltransferase